MDEVRAENFSVTSQSLGSMIDALKASGAHQFDPVRFSFILAMARRAQEQGGSIGSRVNEAAAKALNEYRAAFTQAQKQAALLLQEENTETGEELKALYQAGKFREMKRLQQRSTPNEKARSLSALTDYISTLEPIAKERKDLGSFDDILRQQDQRLLQGVADASGVDNSRSFEGSDVSSQGEPNAIYHLREALVKRNADKLVTQLVDEIPEDAGPLNPQKLIVKSLSSMRDLSPHYLNRFVAYIDTLLWLEEAGG